MSPRRELGLFVASLAALLVGFLGDSPLGGKVLSPGDVAFAQASFRDGARGAEYEPANRLLIDPVLQFQPWLEFSRSMLRRGRLPLWNPYVGCGAPHLANGQSAVFDPFHLIAYLGRLPDAYAPMAAARLGMAGVGMFLLARRWGLKSWGRWFAGLTFPFCGFLIVWLQYPVTSAAVWFPWALLATDHLLDQPSVRNLAALSLTVAATLFAGHVQTSAHVLLATALYAAWRIAARWRIERTTRLTIAWSAGIALGVALAAIEVVPLASYLTRSPVWADRAEAKTSPLALGKPRLLDAACTAFPYLYGSQRRGHPNLAKGLGVHNLNESAGGFAGLATLIWLAPLGIGSRNPRRRFIVALAAFGVLASFGLPPAANVLRALPILDVADNRRLSLWLAFGLVLLGGMGLDRLADWKPGALGKSWIAAWVVGGLGLLSAAALVGRFEPMLRARAVSHYEKTARETPGADASEYRARAERQVSQTLRFVPRYLDLSAAQLLALAALAAGLARGTISPRSARVAACGLVGLDLFGFGYGLNPAIPRADDRPDSPLISYLRREAMPPARILAIGAELPPNMLMRYGLADARNYDSVELTRHYETFAPLYGPGRERTSRRSISWDGVIRSRGLLAAANVVAVVGATPPPLGAFERVDRVGAVWVARLGDTPDSRFRDDAGRIAFDVRPTDGSRIVLPTIFDPGWRAEIDGRTVPIASDRGPFLSVDLPPGAQRVRLIYDPIDVRIAAGISSAALAITLVFLALPAGRKGCRKTVQWAWSAQSDRVRIDLHTLRRPSSRPAYLGTEGRDADGPLHV